MSPLERKLVRRLVFEPKTLSRNRNFHVFQDAEGRRAWRVAAHLRSVRRSVRKPGTESRAVQEADGGWCIEVLDPGTGVRREARLTEAEMDILREDRKFLARLGIAQGD